MSCNIWERETAYWLMRPLYRQLNFLRDDFKRSLAKVYESTSHRLQHKTFIRGRRPETPNKLWYKNAIGWRTWNIASQERIVCGIEAEIVVFDVKDIAQLTSPPNGQKFYSPSCLWSQAKWDSFEFACNGTMLRTKIQPACSGYGKTDEVQNLNTIQWEFGNIVTQTREILNRKSEIVAVVINAIIWILFSMNLILKCY